MSLQRRSRTVARESDRKVDAHDDHAHHDSPDRDGRTTHRLEREPRYFSHADDPPVAPST